MWRIKGARLVGERATALALAALAVLVSTESTPAHADTWVRANEGGFGDIENSWVTRNGADWDTSSEEGFGDANNRFVEVLVTSGPYLYASTYNAAAGAEVWMRIPELADMIPGLERAISELGGDLAGLAGCGTKPICVLDLGNAFSRMGEAWDSFGAAKGGAGSEAMLTERGLSDLGRAQGYVGSAEALLEKADRARSTKEKLSLRSRARSTLQQADGLGALGACGKLRMSSRVSNVDSARSAPPTRPRCVGTWSNGRGALDGGPRGKRSGGTLVLHRPSGPPECRLPVSSRKLFWDCDPEALDWEKNGEFIVARVLAHGDWESIRWLRTSVGDATIREYLVRSRGRALSPRQLRLWETILGLPHAIVTDWIRSEARLVWDRRAL